MEGHLKSTPPCSAGKLLASNILLKFKKKSEDVLTVRELLQKSGGLEVDLFFESKTSCEGKLRFKKNKKLEKDMNNPYFIKVRGKWYVYRLF